MKALIIAMFFTGGFTFFAAHTDLSPNLEHTVNVVSHAAKIHPAFISAVINVSNPSGEIPDSYDLFGTGESYTSCASSLIHFVHFIKQQGIHPNTLENEPEKTVKYLANLGVIQDSSLVLKQLRGW